MVCVYGKQERRLLSPVVAKKPAYVESATSVLSTLLLQYLQSINTFWLGEIHFDGMRTIKKESALLYYSQSGEKCCSFVFAKAYSGQYNQTGWWDVYLRVWAQSDSLFPVFLWWTPH